MWLDGFEQIPATSAGGSFNGSPWRCVLHTTEGGTVDGALAAFRNTGSWPHFTVDPATGRRCQHYPLDVSARALVHPVQGETNRANAIQIEIVGYATDAPTWSADHLRWLATEVLAPIRAVCPFALSAPAFVRYPDSYGTGAAQRFSWTDWAAFSGLCGHEHVPGNDHGDPGGLDINSILTAITPEDDLQPDERAALFQTRDNASWLAGADPTKNPPQPTGQGIPHIEKLVLAIAEKLGIDPAKV